MCADRVATMGASEDILCVEKWCETLSDVYHGAISYTERKRRGQYRACRPYARGYRRYSVRECLFYRIRSICTRPGGGRSSTRLLCGW
jgi:hypothetical protein